jgi:hypothetical protein
MLGNVRIGQKAPDFHCEAVISGAIKGSSVPLNPLSHHLQFNFTDSQLPQRYPSAPSSTRISGLARTKQTHPG